jgi:hypothetical protein
LLFEPHDDSRQLHWRLEEPGGANPELLARAAPDLLISL